MAAFSGKGGLVTVERAATGGQPATGLPLGAGGCAHPHLIRWLVACRTLQWGIWWSVRGR